MVVSISIQSPRSSCWHYLGGARVRVAVRSWDSSGVQENGGSEIFRRVVPATTSLVSYGMQYTCCPATLRTFQGGVHTPQTRLQLKTTKIFKIRHHSYNLQRYALHVMSYQHNRGNW